ncbi:hypothetical protein PEDI_42110 [Persicobacter diffluens]|uniref:Uncharacterized protein n=1 Tax=Persicobacter diffluens TaxID=981 RepID=A0AAN4W0W1_9BACT|nr:hypothetical protein PEDI_42110 [Persicobacter diffluens]
MFIIKPPLVLVLQRAVRASLRPHTKLKPCRLGRSRRTTTLQDFEVQQARTTTSGDYRLVGDKSLKLKVQL